jgi:hypothetical protein
MIIYLVCGQIPDLTRIRIPKQVFFFLFRPWRFHANQPEYEIAGTVGNTTEDKADS